MTPGFNSHFLKLLRRPLKGHCHKNNCGFLFSKNGIHFEFLKKVIGLNFFGTPWVQKSRWTVPLL